MTGGSDKAFWYARAGTFKQGIIENGFFHRTHYDIFGYLFHPSLKNWYSDDYISEIYYNNRCCFLAPYVLFRNTNRVLQHDIPRRELYAPGTLDSASGWHGKRTAVITPIRDKDVLRRVEVDRRFASTPVPIEHYYTHRPADPRCPICRSSRLQKSFVITQRRKVKPCRCRRVRRIFVGSHMT